MSMNPEYSVREFRTDCRGDAVGGPLEWVSRGVAALRLAAADAARRARERAVLRRDLEHLDTRQLRDIGCTRERLEAEARKPFWRG